MRDIDLAALRARLATDGGQTWWRGLDELADTDEFRDLLHREFPEQATEFDDPAGRRQFLKLMGASLSLAGVTACTRIPDEKIVPYVKPPEEVIPGKPLFYATAMPFAGAATPVLVESHMGRPVKIEPNPDHPAGHGSDVFAQAAILTLYDPDRSKTTTYLDEIRPWSAFVQAIGPELQAHKADGGARIRLLTETVTSPTLASQIEAFLAAYPNAQWVQWEPVNRDAARAGVKAVAGSYLEPQYDFSKARVVFSLDADFLTSGPGRLRYARDFMAQRALVGGRTEMNRLYVAEATPSPTGISSDHRIAVKASEVEALARAVAAQLGVGTGTAPASVPAPWIAALVKDLHAHHGASVVIAGDQQPAAVHALALAMNHALGNIGTTVTLTAPVEARASEQDAALRGLVADMAAKKVDLLFVLDANPVYAAPADLDVAAAFDAVKLRVHMGLFDDETADVCHWHVPTTHFLESWGDTRAFDGTVTICQPLIAPLYDGHSALECLSVLNGHPDKTSYDIVHEFWMAQWGNRANATFGTLARTDGASEATFESFFRRAVHDGYVAGSALPAVTATVTPAGVPAAGAAVSGLEVVFRPDAALWDGRFANNGWLMELPRPVTKLTWDNAAFVSPKTAQELGLLNEDFVTLRVNGKTVQAPVWVLPGQPDGSVTINTGYGRTRAGRVGDRVGVDVGPLRSSSAWWHGGGLEIVKNGDRYRLACTQGHFAMEGRALVRKASLGVYEAEPEFAKHMVHAPAKDMTFYNPDEWKYEGYAWGMSIDLNSCTGCNACVVACVAENNIPVVGKDQVMRQREMHWIRIDRYYTGDTDAPDMYYQPVMCQHCESAPCEVVCPVAATVHSDEGLNDMVYNRCVGTRYCSHNCPYKVRRFNFLLYSDWTTPSLKMARNPDVTVRSRGVMEKCTYCVQRINLARIDAKRDDRSVRDGEIVTACQSACPSQAIVFGNINDPAARVSKMKQEPRNYGLLEDLNTRPRTSYLAAVRNPHPDLAPAADMPAAAAAPTHH